MYQCDCCGTDVDAYNSIHLKARSKMFGQYEDLFEDHRRSLDICKDCWEHIGLCTKRIVDRDGKAVKEETCNPLRDVHTAAVRTNYEDWASRSELAKRMSESAEKTFVSSTNTSHLDSYKPRSEIDPFLAMKQPYRIDPESLYIKYDMDGKPMLYYKTYNGTSYVHKMPDKHNIKEG